MITLASLTTGALMTAAGVAGLRYTYQIAGFTGPADWIESKLGSGSTYGAYKFFALLLVVAGVLEVSGLMPGVMNWLLSPLRGVFQR